MIPAWEFCGTPTPDMSVQSKTPNPGTFTFRCCNNDKEIMRVKSRPKKKSSAKKTPTPVKKKPTPRVKRATGERDTRPGPQHHPPGREITESKRIDEAIRESEARYRILAENTMDVISRHKPDGMYTYVSPACKRVLGYEVEEMVGR